MANRRHRHGVTWYPIRLCWHTVWDRRCGLRFGNRRRLCVGLQCVLRDNLLPQPQNAPHGGLGDQAMALIVETVERCLASALYLLQRLRQDVEAFDHLLRRVQCALMTVMLARTCAALKAAGVPDEQAQSAAKELGSAHEQFTELRTGLGHIHADMGTCAAATIASLGVLLLH